MKSDPAMLAEGYPLLGLHNNAVNVPDEDKAEDP